ncbi:methyl-CPG-binding domain 9 [Striga asiatica]|uniref:Methyl-CPG-binding domain 9 n=1 Tax=Striga asiatica TaxID=4170 RepID=A0A5A7PHV3_STRAF|nr:methyl-CPG-binding domain 9 [Striga asiatica]
MDSECSIRRGSARMALPIDLNQAPIPSPREAGDGADLGAANVSICTVCRKGVPVGRIPDRPTEEQRRDFKCFRCLLKNNGTGSSGAGGGAGRFDINASPPREAEDGGDVAVGVGRGGNGGGKIQGSSSHRATRRQINPVLEDLGRYLPKTLSVATKSTNPGFHNLDRGLGPNRAIPFELLPNSPTMVYLQTLREYIAERSGVLGEGWRVEFEFCNKRFKTSPVYIAPDGRRLRSKEDVACHLRLPVRYQDREAENGGSNLFLFTQGGSKFDPSRKEAPAFVAAQSWRRRQKVSRGGDEQGVLSGSLIIGINDGYPIQFQDFCLLSAGNIDPRPAYHNSDQIWPIGYRSSWHDKITGSLFVCDVADGGVDGPIFRVQRYPCTKQPIPVGSTILSKGKQASSKADVTVGKGDLASPEVLDDDSLSTITLLNEDSPPCLETCLSTSKRGNEAHISREGNSSNSGLEFLPQRMGNLADDAVDLSDVIGEFQVEGRSTSYVWEMVSQAFLYAFQEMYKQKGAVKFFCSHDVHGMKVVNLDIGDALLRYCYIDTLISIPPLVQNENEFNMACQMLLTWLNQDRFGLDADFVQEILERLPGATVCSEYKCLNDRTQSTGLQTVGSGFLQAERKNVSGSSKNAKLYCTGSTFKRDPCPTGKPLNSRLPSYLMGDALQVWELAWRFLEVLELGPPFSLQELESELVSPWLDSLRLNTINKAGQRDDKASEDGEASLGGNAGCLYAKIVASLLKLLVSELLSKAAVYVCPNFDAGESKSRRGRKKDLDCLAALKRSKLDMLPVNGLTWHEVARRYILAVLCLDGNLDSTEIASRESGKVFHCLRGDGGILCGSLTGVAALEGDAVLSENASDLQVLADAMKEIFGPTKGKSEVVTVCERESDMEGAQTVEVNDGVIPEWAQVLEPVRKLPTNVGARIRRCINEALEKNPPEWAKKILEHSISKSVYKGNASGPTKRAVISVLENLGKENPEQKVEQKEKVRVKTNLADLITKQCRIVLRRAAALDKDKIFCNLLARIILNPNDNDDEGILGYPAMVSRPLDFRTIDLRLAAGVYGGSHEAFVDDVREVWRNIRNAYGDRSDLVDVAESLSKKFEDLYEKEVLTFIHKIANSSNANDSGADAIKERDDLLVQLCNTSIPRAPWEEGICKVCGMDKDDDNVLLCDKCDSEYHRYCLNPPLVRIPEGNWYCPSCVAGQSITCTAVYANQSRKKKYQGEFTRKFLEELARLAKLMEVKEYWEFTVEERTFFLKFLFDDTLNSATVCDHMEQSASRAADLQQKLRCLTSELKLLKFREEVLAPALVGKTNPGTSPSLLSSEDSSRGKQPEKDTNLLHGSTQPDHIPSSSEPIDCNKQPDRSISSDENSGQSENVLLHAQQLSIQMPPPGGHHCHDKADLPSSKDDSLKVDAIKKDISNLQDSIASVESELLKVGIRKDLLGRDSSGRVYWAFYSPGARPWIVACGDFSSKERSIEEFTSIPDSDKWMYYDSDDEIEKLVGWLRDDNIREKELRESILQMQSNKLGDSHEYTANHILSKVSLSENGEEKAFSSDFFTSKAITTLEQRFGTVGSIHRCECLELLWLSKPHCSSCHNTFLTSEELAEHVKEHGAAVYQKSPITEDALKCKKMKAFASQEKGILQISTSEKQTTGPSFSEPYFGDCPFNLEEILTRFVVPGTVKDAVNEIGLIGNGGVPSFLPSESPYFSDPALTLGPTRLNEAGSSDLSPDSKTKQQMSSSNEPSVVVATKDNRLSRGAENNNSLAEEGTNVERPKCGTLKDRSTLIQISKSSIICESSLRPLVGRACEILRSLKVNLLDMDAALPQDALRMSRTNEDRRRAWRAFVKSAKSIYEMVQATVILEDAIKSEHLRNEWWYWSSPSTAAKITTLSALALRIYSLDAAISYDKPLPAEIIECLDGDASQVKNPENPSSSSSQKTPEPESVENPRSRSRSSKRRKI